MTIHVQGKPPKKRRTGESKYVEVVGNVIEIHIPGRKSEHPVILRLL